VAKQVALYRNTVEIERIGAPYLIGESVSGTDWCHEAVTCNLPQDSKS